MDRATPSALVALALSALPAAAETDTADKKFPDFAAVVKGAQEHKGLFTLYQKDDHLYAEIRPDQFDRPLLAPMAIARGLARGGETRNPEEQWVILFRRVGDRVLVVRRNVHFKGGPAGTPIARAVEISYTDSVLLAVPVRTVNPARGAVVIDLGDVFLTDFAQLNLGAFDPARSHWHKVKAFPRNVELEVEATYSGRGRDPSVIDSRGTTLVIHYSLVELPDPFGYQPRLADDRVGHFLSVSKDFASESKDSAYVRVINRWRLERSDGQPVPVPREGETKPVKLSPPKKKIVFWIERSVPDEYRAAVREGILEWNKAFEKIGFRDAIEVRQQEAEEFDPEDVNYNTFRWITSDEGFAVGPSRANPLTGEIIDADILFDASMIRYYKLEQQLHKTTGGWEEPASLIQQGRRGWPAAGPDARARPEPATLDDALAHERAARQGLCRCATHKRYELGMAVLALAQRKPGEKVTDELIQQAVKETVMHEVGHTLGLRHNFKGSTMLPNDKLHDTAVTRKQGLVGSVMDYNPVNLAPKGVQQGDYFTTTLGPYDYWAIEYAYRPLSGGTEGEAAELQKIAARGALPGHDYATDEDLRTADPLVNQWDLGADPMKFAQDRILLAEELLPGLADRVVEKGEGYQRARQAFALLLRQYGEAAALVSSYVGGEALYRDHKGDPQARDPFVPVTGAKQRAALAFLREHIFSDRPFRFPPELLRKLAADRWLHWGNERAVLGGVEFPLGERVLGVQRVALRNLLDPATLARIETNALKADDDDEEPLTLTELFRNLSDGIWCDLPCTTKGDRPPASSAVRRNLQREYLKELSRLVLGKPAAGASAFVILLGGGEAQPVPADARSLARLHLRELARRIDRTLADGAATGDDLVRAHLEECREQIGKVLSASLQAGE
jgi:hypothetical protein